MGVVLVVLGAAACQDEPVPTNAKLEVTSGRSPNASVSGTVTYRERIALTPDATLEVSLRDVSSQDAAAPLIARQTISDPGQVPIDFKVEYNRDDIDSRNTYAVSARIVESDGRLAFTNDTAYEVITRGNPGQGGHAAGAGAAPAGPGRFGLGLADVGRDARPRGVGQPDSQRARAVSACRLLPVHDRGLCAPGEAKAWRWTETTSSPRSR